MYLNCRSRRPVPILAACLATAIVIVLAGCRPDGERRTGGAAADWTTTFDTLSSGVVLVRNEGPETPDLSPADNPAVPESESSMIRVDLRIGAVDGPGPDVFGQIRDVDVDGLGRIYVLDNQAREIRVFAADGSHVRTIGGEGSGPGELNNPTGMEWGSGGRLWVEDPRNNRYTVYDTTGAFVASHPRDLSWRGFSWAGFFDDAGFLYLLEYPGRIGDVEGHLVQYDSAMTAVDTFSLPSYDAPAYELVQDGVTRMAARVPFAPSLTWKVVHDGTLWFGVSDEYRIVQRALGGDTLRIVERTYDPIPVTAAERDEALGQEFLINMRDEGADIDPARVPEHRPAWTSFTIAPDGSLWVIPQIRDTTVTALDVFDPEGRYLGRRFFDAAFQAAFPGLVVRDDNLYVVSRDELGVQYVLRAGAGGRRP